MIHIDVVPILRYYSSIIIDINEGKIQMDFAAELKKLLNAEESPPTDPLIEITQAQAKLLEGLQKTCSDISLQTEEVYDIVKEADEHERETRDAEKCEAQLLGSLIEMNDLLDSLLYFFRFSDESHIRAINAKRDEILSGSGLERYDGVGWLLDPRRHKVASAEHSDAPLESVIRALESGYTYQGNVIRKATVIVSKGKESE